MRNSNGIVLYEGPSLLDNAPIVAIATLMSRNRKTGNAVQTWILRADINPLQASKEKKDGSVCGDCPLRRSVGGACYVNLGQAPSNIWKAYMRGSYVRPTEEEAAALIAGRFVRLGAYGDPAAVPVSVWKSFVKYASGSVGYTHQLGHPKFDKEILELCMVSAETPKIAAKCHESNLRTFRVKTEGSPVIPTEVVCPSETGVKCADCRACSGATAGGASIVIDIHGTFTSKHTNKYGNVNKRAH